MASCGSDDSTPSPDQSAAGAPGAGGGVGGGMNP